MTDVLSGGFSIVLMLRKPGAKNTTFTLSGYLFELILAFFTAYNTLFFRRPAEINQEHTLAEFSREKLQLKIKVSAS